MKLSRLALVLLVASCGDTTNTQITQLNLDRPVDVAFACWGGLRLTNGGPVTSDNTTNIVQTAMPVDACNIRSLDHTTGSPAPVPPGQEDVALPTGGTAKTGGAWWYAFLLQSGPGTVAIARFDTKPSSSFSGSDVTVLDADPTTPGKNSISVGEDPIAIATDKVGCFEVIANAGSCDLSTLDIDSAIKPTNGDNIDPIVRRMDVKNAAGQLIRARPAAMAFEPAGGVIGNACPAQATGLAYIAYPGCHLVAGVDVATGTIVTGVQFAADGTPTVVDGNVSCPAECDGMPATAGVRPVALDLEADARTGSAHLAIGADNSNVLTVYALDNQTFQPLSLLSVPLENASGRLGLTSVTISPTIGMGGNNGSEVGIIDDNAPGGQHKFVYAVATDGSVRVADISSAPRECDTQVDPRFLHDVRDVDRLSCLPVGDAATPPRRAGVRGPGIELIGDAIPTSMDIVKVDKIDNDSRMPGTPAKLIGYFGMITAANGVVYVLNVDNDDWFDYVGNAGSSELDSPIPLDIAHQLRDNVANRGLLAETDGHFVCDDPGPTADSTGVTTGGPRILGSPTNVIPSGTIAPERTGGLPSIRQVLCDVGDLDNDGTSDNRPVNELFFSAPVDTRVAEFPDLRALRADESWTLTWEGPLSADKADVAIDGPAVRESQMFVDGSGMRLVDGSRPFCDAGVEQWDVVQMRGCDPSLGDSGCPIGYTCFVHPQSQVTGIGSCMLASEAERLSTACKSFLTSQRRYTVSRSKAGELQLLPRKVALRTTPLNGCDSDDQCRTLANYAVQSGSPLNPSDPALPTDAKTWRCQADPDRKPMDPATTTGKRCLLSCNADSDCATGTVCQANTAAAPQMGYCMEGVTPPQACVNAPQRFELRASEAFTVIGSRQGYIHPIVAGAGDVCEKNPTANPLQVGRIPLDPPACSSTADPRTGKKPDGTYDPNPCKATVAETEYQLNYVPGTCSLGTPDETIQTRDAAGLRFRNRALNLTLVDPTYQGDAMCHGDRKGTFQNVPLVTPGFQIAFRLTAGFTPLTLTGMLPAFPSKVLTGPTQSIWVVDEGDFLSTTQASTRGKVYRVESRALGVINVLE